MGANSKTEIYVHEPAMTAEEVRKARREDKVLPAPRRRDED